jgi:ABC-type Mn2+/Zn2+ transport system permease subunit
MWMFKEFAASWPLFHNTYLAGWLIAAVLSMVGVAVVARDQVFLGLAVAQSSMLGIACGMLLAGPLAELGCQSCGREEAFAAWAAFFGVCAALATARGERRQGHETPEAITGWIFALCASSAVLLLSRSPHGLEEVHRLLSSTIIGATGAEVAWFGALLAFTAGFVFLQRDPLTLLLMDREMAGAVGLPVRFWETLLWVWLGLTLGLAIRVSGLIYAFASLVLPALIAKNVAREVRPLFYLAPAIALVTSTAAFVLANAYDLPPGQVSAATQSLVLLLAWLARRRGA